MFILSVFQFLISDIAEFEVLFTVNVSVEVKAKNSHQGSLCGLCGNFNGNADDEFQLKNSKRIASLEKFARSFQVI